MQHYLSQKEEDTQAHTRQTMASFRDNINESSKLQITLEVPEYCILILDQRRESLGKFCHKSDVFKLAELRLSLLCLFCALRSQLPAQPLIFLQVCCSVGIIPLSLCFTSVLPSQRCLHFLGLVHLQERQQPEP